MNNASHRSRPAAPRLCVALLVALGPLGCGGAQEAPSSEAERPDPQAGSEPTPGVEASAAGAYALHEWGLLSASYGSDVAPALAGALSVATPSQAIDRPSRPGGVSGDIPVIRTGIDTVDKPVVYFHLDPGTDALRLAFGVTPAGDGRVLEHFPPGLLAPEGRQLRYDNVRLSRGDCAGTYPPPSDAPCDNEDGVCEVRELARYETTDADCVHVGDTAGGFLFYRTGPARAALPLSVSIESPTAVRVTQLAAADSTAPRVSGWVMRVYRPDRRRATVARLAPLDGADSVVLDRAAGDDALDADAAEAQLSAALVAAGLTPAERDAFMRAWTVPLFGVPDTSGAPQDAGDFGADRALAEGVIGMAYDGTEAPAVGAVEDSLLYILPQASVDALLPLTLQPAPRVSQRVFVARVDLRGTHPLQLTVADVRADGPANADVGRRLIRRHLARFRACGGWGPDIPEATLAIRIQRTGVVDSVNVGGSLAPEVVTCLSNAASAIGFPAMRAAGTLHVTLRAVPSGG